MYYLEGTISQRTWRRLAALRVGRFLPVAIAIVGFVGLYMSAISGAFVAKMIGYAIFGEN